MSERIDEIRRECEQVEAYRAGRSSFATISDPYLHIRFLLDENARLTRELEVARADSTVCERFEALFRSVCPTGGGQVCFNISPSICTGAMVTAYPWEMSDEFDVEGANLSEVVGKFSAKLKGE